MKRRDFITLVGGAVAWPLDAYAQQRRLPTIGFLGSATPSSWGPWITSFVQRLRELGWTEGRNVAIEVRWGEGRSERFAEIAAEFVRLKVDVIVTGGNAALAAKQATSVIPIVLAVAAWTCFPTQLLHRGAHHLKARGWQPAIATTTAMH